MGGTADRGSQARVRDRAGEQGAAGSSLSQSRVPASHGAQPAVVPAHDVSEPLEVGGCEVPVVAVTSLHVLVYAVQI